MDVLEAIRTRRAVRRFAAKKIPEDALARILEAGTCAPSSGNLQNWEFVIVRNRESKKRIAEIAFGQEFVADADVLVIVCSNQQKILRYGERGAKLYAAQNVAACVQNMLLAAHSMGIGSCWVGAFDERELVDFLELPSHVIPHAIIAFGYPGETPEMPPRIPWKKITHAEKYGRAYE